MVDMVRTAWGVALTISLLTLTVVGCASTGSTPVAAKDIPSLAGKWDGWVRTTGGGSIPATLELSPGGDYMTRTGAHETQGKAQIKDGSIVLVGTAGSGRLGLSSRESTASISERNGVMIMRGTGRDDIGPFDFEFTRRQ